MIDINPFPELMEVLNLKYGTVLFVKAIDDISQDGADEVMINIVDMDRAATQYLIYMALVNGKPAIVSFTKITDLPEVFGPDLFWISTIQDIGE